MEDIHLQPATNLLDQASLDVIRLVTEETNWEQVKFTKSIKVSRLIHEGPCITKTFMSINKPIHQIFDYFWNFNNEKLINDKIKKIQEIKSFADNFRIIYVELDLPWPIDNRDFVYAERFISRDDGILIHSKSIEGVLPEVHNIVRGERFLYGTYLKRVSDSVTEITGIISVDPKGSLPNMMKNKMSITEYSKAKKLKNVLLSMQ